MPDFFVRIPGTRTTWPLNLILCRYWLWNGERGGGCQHGPSSQHWPWWKLITARIVVPGYAPKSPCIGRMLWVYYRWGAFCLHVTVDRRNLGIRRKTWAFRLRTWLAHKIRPVGSPLVR
jgi:hypothetical protein